MSAADKNLHCSFCSKDATEVKRLIAGPSTYICDECVELCYSLLDGHMSKDVRGNVSEEASSVEEKHQKEIISPRELKDHLDQYIIGQDYAKMVVAVAVHNHYKRLDNQVIDDVEIDKSNILLAGPTGVGKTFIAQTIARIIDVPFVIADATSLTEAGYVGDDVESIITKLLQAAGGDVEKCERGIVYLDEIDKKQKRNGGGSSNKDVSGEGVQQALLKIIEGTELQVPVSGSKKSLTVETVKVNTKNILFIVGGAFVGLDKVVRDSMNKNKGIGFNSTITEDQPVNELLRKAKPEHLIGFGIIPELIGRLPVLAPLEELSEDQLVRVLTEPKNSIVKQFQKMFQLSGVELEFTEEALRTVAKNAKDVKTGARGLRGVLESCLIQTQYNLVDFKANGAEKVIVTENVVSGESEPEVIYAPKRKSRANPKPNNEEQI